MALILEKKRLTTTITQIKLKAADIARHAKAGQFIILRVCEEGERIPLTIAGYDRDEGTITLIYAVVGATTALLDKLEVGDDLLDLAGPLGKPTEIEEGTKRAVVIGGGLGCAIAWPSAKELAAMGVEVDIVAGFRDKSLVILEDEFKEIGNLTLCTDDGSYGKKGFVTEALAELLAKNKYDLAIAIGPLPMMRAVCEVTRPFEVHTLVSMNPVMIDGTGMCGGCRLTVGGEVKFACVDGPDFDGHKVDFEEAMARSAMYRECEKCNMEDLLNA